MATARLKKLQKDALRVVIVGAGPAGTRCAETLVAAGIRPILLDENRRDGEKQIALSLIAEVVPVLEREENRRQGGQRPHHGEQPDFLLLDVNPDDTGDVVRIAEKQHVLAKPVPIENEPQEHDDECRP